jgi:integrase
MKKTRYPGLTKLPDGRIRIRVTVRCERTGKLREATKVFPRDVREEEALAEMVRMKAELRAESRPLSPIRRLSLNDYAERWLEAKAARVRPGVAERYAHILSTYVLPRLGDLYVDGVTRNDVEQWVHWAEHATVKDGQVYSRDTVQGWWRLLCSLVRDACAEYRLPADPTYRVRPPRPTSKPRRERRTLTAAELGRLLDFVKRLSPDRYAEVYVLAYTGVRAGELFALHWDCVDEDRGRILIQRSVWHGHVTETKTGDPREVALPSPMAEVLRAHRRTLVARQNRGLAKGMVFPSDSGTYRTSASLHKPLALAAERAGIEVRVTPQVLRRTFNTLMVQAGVDRIVLRSQMGHCSEAMTQRYAGVAVSAKHEALARILQPTGGDA